jgi:DinB family protein
MSFYECRKGTRRLHSAAINSPLMRSAEKWRDAVTLHSEALAGVLRSAESVPPEAWLRPLGEGRWTPAQVVEHLTLAYDALLKELSGGPAMKYRLNAGVRLVLRYTVLPRILRGEPFPRARAPRETRPADTPFNQPEAVQRLRDRGAIVVAEMERKLSTRPGAKLTHAYFGRLPLTTGLTLIARHIEHHRKQLA